MSQRLTRKEIKQKDTFLERVGEAIEFVSENLRILAAAGVGALVAVILVLLFLGYRRDREIAADRALAEAIGSRQGATSASGEDGGAGRDTEESRAGFEAVVDEFPGTNAAGIASVYLGEIAIRSGDEEAARAAWEAYLDKHSGHFLATEVELNLMALDRAQGRGDDLVTRLRARLSSGDPSLPVDLLLYQLALTLDSLDRGEEATTTFQRIVDEHPESVYAAEAQGRLGQSSPGFSGVS